MDKQTIFSEQCYRETSTVTQKAAQLCIQLQRSHFLSLFVFDSIMDAKCYSALQKHTMGLKLGFVILYCHICRKLLNSLTAVKI